MTFVWTVCAWITKDTPIANNRWRPRLSRILLTRGARVLFCFLQCFNLGCLCVVHFVVHVVFAFIGTHFLSCLCQWSIVLLFSIIAVLVSLESPTLCHLLLRPIRSRIIIQLRTVNAECNLVLAKEHSVYFIPKAPRLALRLSGMF